MGDFLFQNDIIQYETDETIIPKTPEAMAEVHKESGNKYYKLKDYDNALAKYSEAIEQCPSNASLYGNRAACYMMLNKYKDAIADAKTAVTLDPYFEKGYVRILKCSLALGDLATVEQTIATMKDLKLPGNIQTEIDVMQTIAKHERDAVEAYDKGDYRRVMFCMTQCLIHAPACTKYKLTKAECQAMLGWLQEAQETAHDILQLDKNNADGFYVRGLCLFYEDNIDKAMQHFVHLLKIAPDHSKGIKMYKRAKALKQTKDDGNDAFKSGKFQDACDLYTQALAIDPNNKKTNAKLYYNRGLVLAKLNRLHESIDDCTEALKLDEKYLKALQRRAKSYMDVGQYEDAVRDYEKIVKMDKSRDNRRMLNEAKMALKRSLRKDYYDILGVDKNASEHEIKRAYRKRALVHHPDRHANATESEKKEHERKFKEVGEAYTVLSDPKKKSRYDNGQDLEEMEDMHANGRPDQIFREFFGPQSGQFNFGGGFQQSGYTFQFG